MHLFRVSLVVLLSSHPAFSSASKHSFSDQVQQTEVFESHLLAIVEIPMGSANKYELDEKTGIIVLDRVMSMPVAYPANYGLFPQTMGGDGDPLDVLLFSRFPIHPGVLVLVRPVGVLHMTDGGEEDSKIVCVPATEVDPTYDSIQCLTDLPPMERRRLEAFFKVYKDLPDPTKQVQLSGFGEVDKAKDIVRRAREQWLKTNQ